MKIFINAKEQECKNDSNISDLLKELEISTQNIAIAVNNEIIPKVQWSDKILSDGDKIILIKAVQGG